MFPVIKIREHIPWKCSSLVLGGVELEEIKSLRILGVTLDSELKFETHLREVVWKAATSLGVVSRAGKYFNAYVLFKQDYCVPA